MRYGVEIRTSTMYHLLKSLGFRHSRPRRAARRGFDPQAKAKMDVITQVLSSPAAENHVIYEDECHIHLLPNIGSMWIQRGKQIQIQTPGTNQKRSVFNALDIRAGGFIHLIFDRKRFAELIEFLEYIVVQYPTGRIHIILDNYTIHKARSVQELLAKHPRVRLYFLPCYKQQLNPVEKVWWLLKAVVPANRLYGLMAVLVDAVNTSLDKRSPSQVLTLAA